MITKPILTTKDFFDKDFYSFCQQQYDIARRFLKTCGKPEDDTDRFLIDKHKFDAAFFGKMLG